MYTLSADKNCSTKTNIRYTDYVRIHDPGQGQWSSSWLESAKYHKTNQGLTRGFHNVSNSDANEVTHRKCQQETASHRNQENPRRVHSELRQDSPGLHGRRTEGNPSTSTRIVTCHVSLLCLERDGDPARQRGHQVMSGKGQCPAWSCGGSVHGLCPAGKLRKAIKSWKAA